VAHQASSVCAEKQPLKREGSKVLNEKKIATEALIVGAGPVGLFAAILLAEREIPFQIVDKASRARTLSSFLVLHPWMLGQLDRIGLLDSVLDHGHRIEKIEIQDKGGFYKEVLFSKLSCSYPFLVALSWANWHNLLEECLRRMGGSILWNHLLVGLQISVGGAEAEVEELRRESRGHAASGLEVGAERRSKIESRYVLGADGLDSTVRTILEIPFDETATPEAFASIDFEMDDLPDFISFFLSAIRLMHWPLLRPLNLVSWVSNAKYLRSIAEAVQLPHEVAQLTSG
jgi:2-polyprenyl-6-methoxyphenol hydroxylase-like FAD-dependent oxidoreductase